MNMNPVCTEPSAVSHDPANIECTISRTDSTAENSPMRIDIGTGLELGSNGHVFWSEQLRASNNNPIRSVMAITIFSFSLLAD